MIQDSPVLTDLSKGLLLLLCRPGHHEEESSDSLFCGADSHLFHHQSDLEYGILSGEDYGKRDPCFFHLSCFYETNQYIFPDGSSGPFRYLLS